MTIRVALATRSEAKAEPYRRALEQAGLEPEMYIPGSQQSLDDVGGLLLTGGTDVDTELYGETRQPETQIPDRERDDYELSLLRSALAKDLPVLAICRGLQLFNVACGGTLVQHLPGTATHQKKTAGMPVHDVVLEGRLAEIFGSDRAAVDSRHHQAVNKVGKGLVVAARHPDDGVIEGLVYPAARFALGVQWHPEDMTEAMTNDKVQPRLFKAFADAVSSNGRVK
jgi:gamma-glutamyl-gamma-aminobutyrate hydrolase PuuD